MSKVFVNSENKANLVCPVCTKTRTVDVTKFLDIKANAKLKAKCPCGHSYSVILERRKFYRKEVNLAGVFKPDKSGREYPMKVINISRSGLRFSSSESRNLETGDRILVEFRLDDKAKSVIKKKAIVIVTKGSSVGVEFCFLDDYDKILGFYLFN